jgi:DNA primase
MDIQNLKHYILDNNKIPLILESLGCHDIQNKSTYYSCANKDGDNKTAINVYQNENLITLDYTRDIPSIHGNSDIFSLVQFFQNCSFFEAVKFVCNAIGIDYYYDFDEKLPQSIKITKMLLNMNNGDNSENEDMPVKPINEHILSYYKPYVNDLFKIDGIDYETQQEFEIGYDEFFNRITIPIRDELGNLCGVKGRLLKTNLDKNDEKYLYIEQCSKSKILYGLYKTYQYIQHNKQVFVSEAEKGVMQLYAYGYRNCVATSGSKISKHQIEMLTRLNADIIFCYDKDITKDTIKNIANQFIKEIPVYALIDKNNILQEKESPMDKKENFEYMLKHNLYRIN